MLASKIRWRKFLKPEPKLEWNPRGQVAPQVIVTNVATKQTDKGVAPQSPFEESATTSARWPVRNRVTFGVVCRPGSPFLSDFFVKKRMNSSQKSSKKGLQKKCCRHQTDRQNSADPEQLRGRVLDSQNADTIRKNLQNVSPKQDPEFS